MNGLAKSPFEYLDEGPSPLTYWNVGISNETYSDAPNPVWDRSVVFFTTEKAATKAYEKLLRNGVSFSCGPYEVTQSEIISTAKERGALWVVIWSEMFRQVEAWGVKK